LGNGPSASHRQPGHPFGGGEIRWRNILREMTQRIALGLSIHHEPHP